MGRVVHRALFPRPAPRRGVRPVPQGTEPQHLGDLLQLDDRRQPAPRRADHQRIHVPAELFDLSVADQDSVAIRGLPGGDPADSGPINWNPAIADPTSTSGTATTQPDLDRQLLDQRRSVGGVQGGGGARRDPDLGGRLFADLGQHRRPQESDERHLRQLPSGRRRPRRPVALPARDLRRQVLSIRSPTISPASSICRAARSTRSAAAICR